jgi:large subunit ribosomal protein L2
MLENIFKKLRPVTPSMRGAKLLQKPFLWRKKFLKSITKGFSRVSGRNNFGRITSYHRGGGHKKLYRKVDFVRNSTKGIVEGIEYDPFRTAFLARVYNAELKKHNYIIAPKNMFLGAMICSGEQAEIQLGHSLPLERIPVGSLIHNIAFCQNRKGQVARAAGSYAQLIQKTRLYARLRLMSGEQRLFPLSSYATLGVVSNENSKLVNLGKAGRKRWKNKRPNVRGVAMNPVNHPHGGGEGKTSGGRPSVTPWGKPTRGAKTASLKGSSFVLVQRKKKS